MDIAHKENANPLFSSIEDIKLPLSNDLLVPFVDLIYLLDLQIENIEKACHRYLVRFESIRT